MGNCEHATRSHDHWFVGSNCRMTCHRCHGFMCSIDLLVGASGSGYDSVHGWRCVACGEIVDQVIVQNRIRASTQWLVRREKRPRQPVRMIPAFF
jgi:hypothetical protein